VLNQNEDIVTLKIRGKAVNFSKDCIKPAKLSNKVETERDTKKKEENEENNKNDGKGKPYTTKRGGKVKFVLSKL